MTDKAIVLENLELSLGRGAARVHILKGISLEIERGEAVGLVGASGSGKSTLLMTMAGLEQPDSGRVLVEGTNLSEGRGTTRPFELIGAPWLDPFALVAAMERRNLPGVAFRPTWFTPTASKHANVPCGGVQIHILDREAMRPVAMGLHLLEALREQDPDAFAWRRGGEERYSIDLLLGSDRPRRMLDEGDSVERITAGWAEGERAFADRRRPYLLYS